jgi:starch-binding outer membrane protein, SusD/RagB family
MKKYIKYPLLLTTFFLLLGCEEFLEPKPDQSLVVPKTLNDVRALLDNTVVFNVQTAIPYLASDEFILSDAGYAALATPYERGVYLWEDDPFENQPVADWARMYTQVFYANVALEILDKYHAGAGQEADHLRGTALFLRSYAYHQLLHVFTLPYQREGGNDSKLGLVLRDVSDINAPAKRSNLQETYDQVINDLNLAFALLPENVLPKTRPTKAAALGLLARVQLDVFDFQGASQNAEKALQLYPLRLDFKTLNVALARPFQPFNGEMIFYSSLLTPGFMRSAEAFVNSEIMNSYQTGDLRKQAFFLSRPNNRFTFSKFLTGSTQFFGGISVGELQLIAAEGFYRSGNEAKALEQLNDLLKLRYTVQTFKPITLSGQNLLSRILEERRKELIGRGIRWSDLRRLNQFEESRISLEKTINGQTYRLEPGSPKYSFPIPIEEIVQSGIEQNPRN